jgi:hypothetical protein
LPLVAGATLVGGVALLAAFGWRRMPDRGKSRVQLQEPQVSQQLNDRLPDDLLPADPQNDTNE